MSELEETKFWVALTKLQSEWAEIHKQITEVQLDTDRRLRELTTVVHDLATIVASHERRLAELES